MDPKNAFRSAWQPYVVAIPIIAAAAALRLWPLQSLGVRVAWLTFYPAVMIAALYGGFSAGLLGTFLSCLTVWLLLPVFVAQPFIRDSADWLGMAVFFITCMMISGVTEALHRARAREKQTNEQLEAANGELENEIAERKRAEAEILRRNRELSVLYTISQGAGQSLDLEQTLSNAMAATLAALEIEVGALLLLEPDGETLTLRVHRGLSEELARAVQHIKLGEGVAGNAAAEKKPVVLDISEYPTERLAPYFVREQIRTTASTPLLSAGEVVGTLSLGTRRVRAFPPEELGLLTAIGQQLGSAVRNAQLYETVQWELAERKRAEAAIQKLNADLERRATDLEAANKELEAFSYSVSHDLRAPLRGIDGWSLALLEDYGGQLDERGQEYIQRVRSESQRMGRLIDDLLQLSHLTRAEMRKERVDLSAIAQTIATHLQESAPERAVEFSIHAGLTAQGDVQLLEVVLTNLLGNATKFTGKTPNARIEFGQTEIQGERAFFVRDNGAGFDMAFAKKLFGAFQRMHKPSEFPGTGVGLATVQRIIHRHGGRVWAESTVHQGATFYFTLEEDV